MALPSQEVYPAVQFIIPGVVTSDNDGSRMLAISAGETITIRLVFALPRSTATDKGTQLNSISLVYRIASGTITSMTPTLTQIINSNAAVQTNTNIPLNAASPAFVLTSSSTLFNRPVNGITTPAFDNQIAGVSTEYTYAVSIVAATNAVVEIHGAEALYTLDVMSNTGEFTDIIMTPNVPVSISHVADSAADDFTISQTGAFDASLLLTSAGTGSDAIALTASAVSGGIALTSGSTGILLNTTGPIILTPNTFTILTHTANSTGDDLLITQTGAVDASLILLSAGTNIDAIFIHAANTTGGVTIQSGANGISLLAGTTGPIIATATTVNVTSTGNISLNAGAQTVIQGATLEGGSITSATVLTAANSGTFYSVAQAAGYTINIPTPSAGLIYKFLLASDSVNTVEIVTTGIFLIGNIVSPAGITAIPKHTKVIFTGNIANLGDTIEIYGISSTEYLVRGITSANGGIQSS